MLKNNSLEPVLIKRLDLIRFEDLKYLVTSFIDFSVYRQSFTSLLVYYHFLLQNIDYITNNVHPKMINLQRGQKCFKTYNQFV